MDKIRKKVSHISVIRKHKDVSAHSKTGCALAAVCAALLPSREILRIIGHDSARIIQNFQLIWLDIDSENFINDIEGDTISKFQYFINNVHVFNDINKCVECMKKIEEENVFMIISGIITTSTISRIHHLNAINSIYLLNNNDSDHESWIDQWPKIKAIFMDMSDLCKALEKATKEYDRSALSMSFIENYNGQSDQHIDSSFVYIQILKDIILPMKFGQQDLKEWMTYYRKYILDNPIEQQNTDKFEREYRHDDALRWYTSQSLLCSVLNRSLRTMDIDTIIKMSFFIHDLHQQITELHHIQNLERRDMSPFIVYRGQGISTKDFDQLKKIQGGLISFNNFLSASNNRQESLKYIRRKITASDSIGILFEITVDPSITGTPFANIHKVISNQMKEEILFSIQPIFRIGQIKPIDKRNNRLWKIKLTLVADNDQQLHTLTKNIREETFGNRKGWSRLSELFLKEDQLNKVQQICDNVIYKTSDDDEKALLFYQLGFIKFRDEQYTEANSFYHTSLQIRQKILPPEHVDLAPCYNEIGLVYEKMGEYERALLSCYQATDIYKKNLPVNHPLLAICRSNIGRLYGQLGEYSRSILLYKRALKIYQNILPLRYSDIIATYNSIASIYEKMDDNERAISFFEKAAATQEKTLPTNHPDIGYTYNNLAFVYEKLHKYSNALSYYEKSLKIYEEHLPANHPDLAALQDNIGLLYCQRHDFLTALPFFQKAYEIYRKILPLNHPNLATSYTYQGMIYEEIGKYSKALLFYKKAFEIYQNIQPLNYLDIATSYSNIGSVYSLLCEYPTALLCYEKALKNFQKHSPSDPVDLAYLYSHHGELYEKMNDQLKALSFYEQAFNTGQKALSEDHPSLQQWKHKIEMIEGQSLNDVDVLIL